jgi:hypothetical protein
MEIPTYDVWLKRWREWCDTQSSLHSAATTMAARVARVGIPISEFTLRYHYTGRYDDVGLGFAKAVWDQLDALEREQQGFGDD